MRRESIVKRPSMGSEWELRPAGYEDIDQVAAHHGSVFNPSVGIWVRALLSGKHPTVSVNDCVVVRNRVTGEIASSLCFIKQKWFFGKIPLTVGQIELVGTKEAYRGQGLVREQMKWFDKKLNEQQCELACVQGIPAFYQKLGYDFAIDLKGGVGIALDQLPLSVGKSAVIRTARINDASALVALHHQAVSGLVLRSEMSEALWRYQEQQPVDSKHAYETYVLEEGIVQGYIRLRRLLVKQECIVREMAAASPEHLSALGGFVRELLEERGISRVVFQLPACHPALAIVKSWGGTEIPPFGWMVRVVEWQPFLRTIASELEQRLTGSRFGAFTGNLAFGLENEGNVLTLKFDRGRLRDVSLGKGQDEWQLKMTRAQLTALLLGYRSRAQLQEQTGAMIVKTPVQDIVDQLFPRLNAYIYETY